MSYTSKNFAVVNKPWLSAPLLIVNVTFESADLSLCRKGSVKKSQPNQLTKGCCTVWSSKPAPHLQESAVARSLSHPGACSWQITASHFGDVPPAPSSAAGLRSCRTCCCCSSRGWSCLRSQDSWHSCQAEAFLLSSFICFSGAKSSCHLAAPQ